MKNFLLCGINIDFVSVETLNEIKNMNSIDNLYMIVDTPKDNQLFSKLGICYERNEVAQGFFSKDEYSFLGDLEAIDSSLDGYMSPYVIQIFEQQRRYEEYHMFSIASSYENHYHIYMTNLLYWYNFLKKKKISHLFMSSVPHEGFSFVIYLLCKYLNIPTCMVYNSLLPYREYVLGECLDSVSELKREVDKLSLQYGIEDNVNMDQDAEVLFDNWNSLEPGQMTPWYMREDPLKRRFRIRFGQISLLEAWYDILGRTYRDAGMKRNIRFFLYMIRDSRKYITCIPEIIRRNLYAKPIWKRTLELNEYYDNNAIEPDLNQKYIYFALHYQPEASSNPLGGMFTDQRMAIRMLSNVVNEGTFIYVKSHPEQLAPFRSKQYYDEILSMKNVRLVKQGTSTYELIKNAWAVSSITGTVCWEAQFYHIPAILFGYSQKNVAPLSYEVHTLEECKEAIESIELGVKTTNEKQLRIFTQALWNTSYSISEREEKLVKIITDFIQYGKTTFTD